MRGNGNGEVKKGKGFLKLAHETHFLVHHFTVTEQFRRKLVNFKDDNFLLPFLN